MSYLGANVPGGGEAWEKEYGRFVTQGLAQLTHFQRMAILMSVGLVTAIEISNLQVGGQVATFMTQHRGFPIPSPSIMEKMGNRFRRDVKAFATNNGVPDRKSVV